VADRRYLLGVLVYNGKKVVPRCLESAARLVSETVDVVVFDDASPEQGWSAEVAGMCDHLGLAYYRNPRNLGIPRNMSLVMKTALHQGHDVVGLVNSDVVLPANLLTSADAVLDNQVSVGSITPWSNNVSAFSLPMGQARPGIEAQGFVDAFSTSLESVYGPRTVTVPTGVGYCLLIPREALERVGLMDPIFGRGYCEEVDWCQRARAAGLDNVLGLGCYVFHEGSGTNQHEGLLAHGQTTVPAHEQLLLHRYPSYTQDLETFFEEDPLVELGKVAMGSAMLEMARHIGFQVLITNKPSTSNASVPSVLIGSTAGTDAVLSIHGLAASMPPGTIITPDTIVREFGSLPTKVVLAEPGALGQWFGSWARTNGVMIEDRSCYPNGV
jgi:GT2 family glycosyltransferase